MSDSALVGFLLVFAVIGGTELIDRTNFALIGLASRERPSRVWIGATAAFALTTLLSVAIGAALIAAVGASIWLLRLGGGLFLLGYAGYLFFVPEHERRPPSGSSAVTTAFLLIFLLELGDTTMILTILFMSTIPSPVVVGSAAALALALVAGSACLIGSRLGSRVEPKKLERGVIVVLVAVGALTVAYALAPALFSPLFG